MRLHSTLFSAAVLAALCTMLIGGCGGGTQEQDGFDPSLNDGELGAAVPGSTSGKITICHVPPGNPANAHTIVVGASGWNGHRKHPGDYQGPCNGGGTPPPPPDGGTSEPPPPPPPDAGTPDPVCAPAGAACGETVVCCGEMTCFEGACQPILQ